MDATVTISLEIELAWGLAHIQDADPQDRHSKGRRRETETLERLLGLCDDLGLPVSFDVVGHLLLDSCAGTHDGPYPPGWFDADPGTDSSTDPLYYAPDLVERVRKAEIDHEVCTHTFSHARCDEVSEAVIDQELEHVIDLHDERDLPSVQSFVPPVHAPPPRDVLVDHGIRTVRSPVEYRPPIAAPSHPENALARMMQRIGRLHPVEMVSRTPSVYSPAEVDGVVETYTSWHASLSAPYLQNGTASPHLLYRTLPRSVRQRHHRRYLLEGLQSVASNDGCIHYWSHLFNLSNDVQWPPIRSFLEALASYRDRDAVQIKTMAELGECIA
ncbi:polysaccharide deacetylase [Halostella sp. JP-L12]|uniref:polysaccharide deacetylase n=1 Tax=Halostella TaxID=1843185 RepID=UPI0013CF327E|nr:MULTISPECIES: polysaccharide deacetylase [Halostella]NHN46529.1 polysaccharide deacetylase [Halostella sp. JP-L12]